MAKKTELDEPAIYYIPNNFITKGTVLGGTFKTRNVIDAAAILFLIGYPIISIHMNLTVKIVLLCILCLPLAILALVGVNDGPLSQFLLDFIRFKKFPHEYEYDMKHSDRKAAASEDKEASSDFNGEDKSKKKKVKKSKKQKEVIQHEKEQ